MKNCILQSKRGLTAPTANPQEDGKSIPDTRIVYHLPAKTSINFVKERRREKEGMIKDVIISALAAVLAVDKLSQIMAFTSQERAGLWIAVTVILIAFCVFLDEVYEKRLQRKARVQQTRLLMEQLAEKDLSQIHGSRRTPIKAAHGSSLIISQNQF